MTWLALAVMLAPVYCALCLVFWMAYKAGEKAEAVIQRIEKIETVDDGFTGTMHWPIDADVIEWLRDASGDEDDTRRRQFDAIVAMDARRH